ncbi:MATE family efflux transporter [Mycoplasmatota bacterium WC44]
MLQKFIGNKKFYKNLLTIVLPIAIQQLITASVQLVDNVMVGSLGESTISAVAVTNQMFFVLILLVFGIVGGAGIYTAQYFGSKDYDKLKQTYRFKVIFCLILAGISTLIVSFYGENIIRFFTDSQETIDLGKSYLSIVRFTIIPMFLSIALSSTFREIAMPKLPMVASLAAIFVNTILNYVLIFGNFGFPQLGIVGAAYATLIARCVELVILLFLVKSKGQVFSSSIANLLKVEKAVLSSIFIVALPMMLNEVLWALGQTAFLKAYSTRGDIALAAFNISNTISQLVFVVFAAMSTAIAVMVGNTLGANELEEAKENSIKLLAFSVFVSFVSGLFLIVGSFFIPDIYNVADVTKEIVSFNLKVNGLFIPLYAFNAGIFFVLRAGGDTKSALIMDALFMWVVSVPIALALAYLTKIDVRYMFLLVQCTEIIKLLFSSNRYKKGYWIKNLAA